MLALKLFRALHPEAPTRVALVALSAESLGVGPGRFPESALEAALGAVRRLLLAPAL